MSIGATRDNLLQAKKNLERRREELKAALGITHRRQHKNLKRRARFAASADPLVIEYRTTGESIRRLCEEIARLKDTEQDIAA